MPREPGAFSSGAGALTARRNDPLAHGAAGVTTQNVPPRINEPGAPYTVRAGNRLPVTMGRKLRAMVIAATTLTLAACGEDFGPDVRCGAENSTQQCFCPGGRLGVQACSESGAWSACDCGLDPGPEGSDAGAVSNPDAGACEVGRSWCDGDLMKLCDAAGRVHGIDCQLAGDVCINDDTGARCQAVSRPRVCEPKTTWCWPDFEAVARCNEAGSALYVVGCEPSELCHEAQCQPRICTPRTVRCIGSTVVQCDARGATEVELRECGPRGCRNGACDPPTDDAPACNALGVSDAFADLVAPTCATAGCHGQGAMQGGLSLEGDLSLLVDHPANTAACASRPLIDSTAVEDSVMLQVLEPNPPCSSPMPFPLGGLSQDQKDCIRAWAESLVQDAE